MKTVVKQLRFIGGGPLDGKEHPYRIPVNWAVLRMEHREGNTVHVYLGPIEPGSERVLLQYRGAEALEVEPERDGR